jgi:hypothetical protein
VNIEVAKSDLEAALKVVSLTVGSGSDLSSHYLFRVHDGTTQVLSYNMRVFSLSPMISNTQGNEGDAFTVEAWRLDKWVSSVGDGVLTLMSDTKGEVIAKGPRSRIKLRSLDASRFPFWDGLVGGATDTGLIDPSVLHRALNMTKHFVSSDETNRPELCQAEAIEGSLKATNRGAVSDVLIRDLPVSLRILGKDISTVLKFLSDKTTLEGKISIREATRPDGSGGGSAVVFHRPDRSYVGVSRPVTPLPALTLDIESESSVSVSLNIEEFMGAIDVLLASAPKGHGAVTFSSQQGGLVLSMPSEAGGHDEYPMILSSESGLEDQTFTLDYSYLKTLADLLSLETLTLGVHQRGRGGYVSFFHDEGSEDDADSSGNRYYTVILWRN